jgi:hypothetical protein
MMMEVGLFFSLGQNFDIGKAKRNHIIRHNFQELHLCSSCKSQQVFLLSFFVYWLSNSLLTTVIYAPTHPTTDWSGSCQESNLVYNRASKYPQFSSCFQSSISHITSSLSPSHSHLPSLTCLNFHLSSLPSNMVGLGST